MTETQQKCFLAVAEHKSFSKAAEVLYVSQPAISKSIGALEAEIGASLFARQGKYVSLTRAGEIFRDFLMDYGSEFQAVLERISKLEKDIYTGNVTIGCDTTWNAAPFLEPLMEHFSRKHPKITMDVAGLEPNGFISALYNREVDAVIMYSCDVRKTPDLVALPFTSIGCGFLASASMPVQDPDNPSLEDLRDQTFLVVDSATEKSGKLIYNKLFMDIYRSINPSPKLRHCRSLAAAQLAVTGGKGVMFADGWTSALTNSRFRYFPLEDKIELCLVYLSANADTHVQLFAEEACRLFGGGTVE